MRVEADAKESRSTPTMDRRAAIEGVHACESKQGNTRKGLGRVITSTSTPAACSYRRIEPRKSAPICDAHGQIQFCTSAKDGQGDSVSDVQGANLMQNLVHTMNRLPDE